MSVPPTRYSSVISITDHEQSILNYFSICTSEKERGRYMSGIGLVWGLGAILGPVVGGAFSISAATWRWSFYINL